MIVTEDITEIEEATVKASLSEKKETSNLTVTTETKGMIVTEDITEIEEAIAKASLSEKKETSNLTTATEEDRKNLPMNVHPESVSLIPTVLSDLNQLMWLQTMV